MNFLNDPQPAVRQVVVENLLGFSGAEPHRRVFAVDSHRPVHDVKRLTKDSNQDTARNALSILANLCQDENMLESIAEDESFVNQLVLDVCDLKSRHADIACILLANVAKSDRISKILDASLTDLDRSVFKSSHPLDCLMECFVKGKELNPHASFDLLAYFFADVSRFVEGRNYFITVQAYDGVVPLSKIMAFTQCDSKVRREGVAYTIKNSLFETKPHMRLLNALNLLPHILLPIAELEGLSEEEKLKLPDELQGLSSDKKSDPVPEITAVHLESLLLLCVTKEGREYLRGKSVYPLIRELHKVSNNDLVLGLCEQLVQMLMRDEEPEKKVEEIDESDDEAMVEVA